MAIEPKKPWGLIKKHSNYVQPIREQSTMSALLVRTSESSASCDHLSNDHTGLNIGAHKEAAEHFLSALNLQETSSGDTSEPLWLTLRRALMAMVRITPILCRY